MKLLLISAVVLGLVVCQVQTDSGPDIFPSFLNVPRPASRRHIRMEIVDSLIGKFQETLQNIVSVLNRVKRPLKDNGFSSLATLVDNIMDAISRFSDNVGRVRRGRNPLSFRNLCEPGDKSPECLVDYGGY